MPSFSALEPDLPIAQVIVSGMLGGKPLQQRKEVAHRRTPAREEDQAGMPGALSSGVASEFAEVPVVPGDDRAALDAPPGEHLAIGEPLEVGPAVDGRRVDTSLAQDLAELGRDHRVEQQPQPMRRSNPARYAARSRSENTRFVSIRSSMSSGYAP